MLADRCRADRVERGDGSLPVAAPFGGHRTALGAGQSGSVRPVRIAGIRLGAPVARLLSEILESEGYPETAGRIAEAIDMQVTVEAPLTAADHAAIADALGRTCPPTLYRLRTRLVDGR